MKVMYCRPARYVCLHIPNSPFSKSNSLSMEYHSLAMRLPVFFNAWSPWYTWVRQRKNRTTAVGPLLYRPGTIGLAY